MEPVNITAAEKEMLAKIGEALEFNTLKFDELYYAYRYLKAQGIAAETDVIEITNLGVPLIQALADVKSVSTEDIQKMLLSGTITNEDVQNAFFRMTSEGEIFF